MNRLIRLITINTFNEKSGKVNSDAEKIVLIIDMASVTDVARKNIHAINVRKNVNTILENSVSEGNNLPFATISIFSLFLLLRRSGRK